MTIISRALYPPINGAALNEATRLHGTISRNIYEALFMIEFKRKPCCHFSQKYILHVVTVVVMTQ